MSGKYCFFRDKRGLKKIDIDQIVFMEVTDNYIKFFMNNRDEPFSVRATLDSALSKLPSKQFLRASRTYAVSIDHVEEIRKEEIILIDVMETVPVSRLYYPEIIKQLSFLDAEPPKIRIRKKIKSTSSK